eukprot:SAG31_NODE_29231_length_398_cov_4.026756_2_plen_40_part_01
MLRAARLGTWQTARSDQQTSDAIAATWRRRELLSAPASTT